MIPALWYKNIYLIIVTALTIFVTLEYSRFPNKRLCSHSIRKYKSAVLLPIFFTLFIGLRPISSVFMDMANYDTFYHVLAYGREFAFDWSSDNYLFDNLFNWLASKKFAIEIFFFIIAAIYFFSAYIACKKLFPKDQVLSYIVFLAAFSTFSYATNGIKAGAAASLFLCAIAYRENWKVCVLMLFLSLGFHHSMILPVGGFIICLFLKRPKFFLWFWCICLILALGHITFFQILFAGMSDDQGLHYLNAVDNAWGGKTGFRYDFVLYSAVPIVLGYYAIISKRLNDKSSIFVVNLYTFVNAIWMLCMYANFTNRIAYLSWLIYPIALIIPYLRKPILSHQYKTVNYIVWFQLLFTLAMAYIYG